MRPDLLRALAFLWALAGCARQPDPPAPLPVPAASRSAPAPAPPPPAPRTPAVSLPPFDFTAYGDCRSDHGVHRRICASMLRSSPKFVVVSGDLVDWGGSDEDWRDFRDITRELRAATPYFPAQGNHDTSLDRRFEKEFGLEKPYYEKRLGDVHLFLLDSNDYFDDPDQIRWLEEKAAASDARHKIASFHHPPFSVEPWGDYEQKPVRERLHPLLVKLKFCAAFCGHHHAFYTTKRDGVRYVVTAGGGAPLYPIDPDKAIPGDLFRRFHHYVGCAIQGRKIAARVFDPDGVEAPDLAFTVCEHP